MSVFSLNKKKTVFILKKFGVIKKWKNKEKVLFFIEVLPKR